MKIWKSLKYRVQRVLGRTGAYNDGRRTEYFLDNIRQSTRLISEEAERYNKMNTITAGQRPSRWSLGILDNLTSLYSGTRLCYEAATVIDKKYHSSNSTSDAVWNKFEEAHKNLCYLAQDRLTEMAMAGEIK